jgi:hypothetical protein
MNREGNLIRKHVHEYSGTETVIANVPYTVMVVTGAALIGWGFGFSTGALAGAAAYVAYGVGGAVWIMVFICRYCAYYGTRGCPCGYGVLAARLVRKGQQECFAAKFKRHIPMILPLWFIPIACGVIALNRVFSTDVAALLAAFAVNSFIILPLVSRRHACSDCPQKDGCPWMAKHAAVGKRQTVMTPRSYCLDGGESDSSDLKILLRQHRHSSTDFLR